jgi:hypothetical protein
MPDNRERKPNRTKKQSSQKKRKQQAWRKQRARTINQEKQVRNKFEGRLKKQLEEAKVDYLYEAFKIEYVLTKTYLPDFAIKHNNIIIEAKGVFDADDRRKHLAIKEQHPELDIRFIFVRDNKLRRGAKTTYSEWCNYHGFKYAFGEIPSEWLEEIQGVDALPIEELIETNGGKIEQRLYERRQEQPEQEQDSQLENGDATPSGE